MPSLLCTEPLPWVDSPSCSPFPATAPPCAAMGAMFGALTTFSSEAGIIQRERSSKSYHVLPYYLARFICDMPLRVGQGLLFGACVARCRPAALPGAGRHAGPADQGRVHGRGELLLFLALRPTCWPGAAPSSTQARYCTGLWG